MCESSICERRNALSSLHGLPILYFIGGRICYYRNGVLVYVFQIFFNISKSSIALIWHSHCAEGLPNNQSNIYLWGLKPAFPCVAGGRLASRLFCQVSNTKAEI